MPKKIYQGKKVLELCTACAVATYNDGVASVARVLGQLGIVSGYHNTMGTQELPSLDDNQQKKES